MAKILTWREDWTLRIDPLDDDHRRIVDLLLDIALRFRDEPDAAGRGDFGDTGVDPGGEGGLYDALARLGEFTRNHFRREEEFMRTIDYPGLAEHRSEHALLMAEHTAMVRELRARGAERLAPEDLENLKHWVVAHILGADRGFADFYFEICGGEQEVR